MRSPVLVIMGVLLLLRLMEPVSGAMTGTAPLRSGDLSIRPVRSAAAAEERHRTEQRILAVVRDRTRDPRVLDRVREKLSALHERDVRLAQSLCDRIAAGKGTARADIAFTIIAALLVLS